MPESSLVLAYLACSLQSVDLLMSLPHQVQTLLMKPYLFRHFLVFNVLAFVSEVILHVPQILIAQKHTCCAQSVFKCFPVDYALLINVFRV